MVKIRKKGTPQEIKLEKSAYRCCEVCVKAVVRYRLRYDKVKEEEKGR